MVDHLSKLLLINCQFSQESTLKKKLKTKTKKKKPVKVKEGEKDPEEANEQEEEEEEEGDGNEGEQENLGHREKASSALIPPKKGKLKRKTKVKEETLDVPESLDNDEKPLKGCNQLLMDYTFFGYLLLKKKEI